MKTTLHSIHKLQLLLLSVIVLLFAACNGGGQPDKKGVDTTVKNVHTGDTLIAGSFNGKSGIAFDSTAIDSFIKNKPLFKDFAADFALFYRNNKFNYVWYDNKGLIEPVSVLAGRLMHMKDDGLTDSIPYEAEFLKLTSYNDSTGKVASDKPDLNTELMLTGEYFNFARKVWAGQFSDKAESLKWYLPRKKVSFAELLEKNIATGQVYEEDNLVLPQYMGLKKALSQYRDIEAKGPQVNISTLKKNGRLKINDTSAVIPFIKGRLALLGDYNVADNVNTTTFSPALGAAISQFKTRHGLKGDSIIDNSVINALNVPIKKRIEQLIVNMERFRWMPVDKNSPEFILVNVPEFTLHYFMDHKEDWSCNVVVGKPMSATVIFSGDMKYVVFSPYWYVPPSIIRSEISPGMKRNSNYLAAHNMEWNGGNVRQKPGPNNSLGLVKFLFPNSNNIYLHDTPAKSLFSEDSRAFSHGCIRVAQPFDLAVKVLKQDSSWTPEKINAAMHTGKEKYVTLKKTIPVYIGYFTAFMDKNGQVNFRDDIYGRDSRLLQMLETN